MQVTLLKYAQGEVKSVKANRVRKRERERERERDQCRWLTLSGAEPAVV